MTEDGDRDDPPLLEVSNLRTHFPITKGILRREVGRVKAVDGVSFTLERGETLGLVGESGSGKTTTALSTLLLEEPTAGEIRFDGEPVTDLSGRAKRSFYRRAQLVVQDPNDAFNPRLTVGEAVAEPLALHGMDDPDRRRAIVEDLLERVGVSADDADRYPHAFSGGEKQRIAIARALVLNPDLIVADEPTSALDARVQTSVLSLLEEVSRTFDIAVLFISHDIDVVRRFCDRIAVMYLGEIVERGPTEELLAAPAHPYTRLLVGSVPSLEPGPDRSPESLTETIPDPSAPPSGCRFHTRCPELIPPASTSLSPDVWRRVAAFRFALETGEYQDLSEAVSDDQEVRTRIGVPEWIPDPQVERAVETAIERLLDGNREAAIKSLAAVVTTVCENEVPSDHAHEGTTVRCHRYDDACEAAPLEWERTPSGSGHGLE